MRQPLGSLLAGNGLFDHAHDVALFHDQIFDPVDLDLRARPFAEQHAVANLEVDGDDFPGLVAAAWTDGDHLSLRRLLFGGIRNEKQRLVTSGKFESLLLSINWFFVFGTLQGRLPISLSGRRAMLLTL